MDWQSRAEQLRLALSELFDYAALETSIPLGLYERCVDALKPQGEEEGEPKLLEKIQARLRQSRLDKEVEVMAAWCTSQAEPSVRLTHLVDDVADVFVEVIPTSHEVSADLWVEEICAACWPHDLYLASTSYHLPDKISNDLIQRYLLKPRHKF